jgi:hypothetical protein
MFFFSCVNLTIFSNLKNIRQNFNTKKKEKQTLMLMSSSKTTVVNSDFFAGEFWPNFGLKIYDFHLHKGFIMGKDGTNSPDFNPKRKIQIAKFYAKFQ